MPEKDKTSNKEPHHPHDKGYKQLLSNKRTFLELIKTFVREDWVKEIDEGDLVKVDKSYVLQDFSEKEADIVYRLWTKETGRTRGTVLKGSNRKFWCGRARSCDLVGGTPTW